MVLYLAAEKNTNLLDFWIGQENVGQTPVKKMVGRFTLKQFVVYDMRSFSHLTEVVLDRMAFDDSDDAFGEAVEEFLTMYQARVTVIYEGLKPGDLLFSALLACGVGNIVTETEIQEIRQEIRECLSRTGMTRYLAAGSKQREWYQFDCKNVKIAVVSSQPRTGATTVAVGLCSWLAQVGAAVTYVEANDSRHLRFLAGSYEMERRERGYFFEGVNYQEREPEGDNHFIVYDIGNRAVDSWAGKAEIVVCVCGTKPYELPQTVHRQRKLGQRAALFLCPFVAEEMRGELTAALENDYHKLLFVNYQPELTNVAVNADIYRRLVSGYILAV